MDFENAKSKTKAAGWTGLVIGEPTRITVFPDRGKNFKLRVPQNGDQDQEFFETLQQRWKESKSGFDAIFSGS